MSNDTHLSPFERDQIAELKAHGRGPTAIGKAIGRDESSISRELRRNARHDGVYRPASADGCYMLRRQREAILERDVDLKRFVLDRLSENGTPDQIPFGSSVASRPGERQ